MQAGLLNCQNLTRVQSTIDKNMRLLKSLGFCVCMLFPQVTSAQFVNGGVLNNHEAAPAFNMIFDALSSDLNQTFSLNRRVTLTAANCNSPNAFYSRQTSSIVFCLELLDMMRTGAQRSNLDQTTQGIAILSQVLFVVVHEVGHSLIDILNIPVIGQEEDGADQLAALLMSDEPVAAM